MHYLLNEVIIAKDKLQINKQKCLSGIRKKNQYRKILLK